MNLANAHVIEPKKDDEKTKKRVMVTAGVGDEKDMLLEAESAKDAKDWIDALRQHCRYASAKDKSPFPRLPSYDPAIPISNKSLQDTREAFPRKNTESPPVHAMDGNANEPDQIIDPIPWFVMKVIRVDTREKVIIF